MRVSVCFAIIVLLGTTVIARPEAGAFASAAPDPAGVSSPVQLPRDSYRICPGDVLFISVEGEELFTRECQVSGAGTISYPLLGDIRAAGLTTSVLQSQLTEDLGRYLRQPRVMVMVRQYGQSGMSVFVMGEVARPGAYALGSGGGLMQPIAAAGGVTDLASGEVTVMKALTGEARSYRLVNGGGSALEGGQPGAPVLDPGDVIVVERKQDVRYAVLGEVPNPGMFEIPPRGEARVLDAMMHSGLLEQSPDSLTRTQRTILDDPSRTADLENAFLTRGGARIPVNLAALLQGDTSQNPPLQPGDVLTVPRRPSVRVYALGEVRLAGRQSLAEGAHVLDLLSAAGGVTSNARPGQSSIVRLVEGEPKAVPIDLVRLLSEADSTQNVALQEGDVLYVPARGEPSQAWRLLSLLPYLF